MAMKEGTASRANLTSIVNNAAKQSFNQLVNSPYCRSHIILPAREHGFLEGGAASKADEIQGEPVQHERHRPEEHQLDGPRRCKDFRE